MVKKKVSNETKNEKFKRIATHRTRKILRMLKILGNCSKKSSYSYTKNDINRIFNAVESETKRVKALFKADEEEKFEL